MFDSLHGFFTEWYIRRVSVDLQQFSPLGRELICEQRRGRAERKVAKCECGLKSHCETKPIHLQSRYRVVQFSAILYRLSINDKRPKLRRASGCLGGSSRVFWALKRALGREYIAVRV